MMKRVWRRWRWYVGGVVVIFGVVCLSTWPTDMLMAPLTVHEMSRSSDVVIVLGSGTTNRGDHLPLQAKSRVLEGEELIDAGYSQEMIVSGGRDASTKLVEADVMRDFAFHTGLLTSQVVTEGQSRDTYENAVNSLAIMRQHGWRTALVVTSPYHTWRACRIFRKLGGDVRCIPAPFTLVNMQFVEARLSNFRSVVREYGAIVYGWFRGYL